MKMDITVAKCIVLVTLFLITFLFGMLPLKLMSTYQHIADPSKRAWHARAISLLSCFAGGVFMGTGLLDLFPEVKETLTQALDSFDYKHSFPVPEFAVAFGFFVVLVLEQVVLDYKERDEMSHVHIGEDLHQTRRRLVRQGSIEGISDHVMVRSHSSAEGDSVFEDDDIEPQAHSKLRSVLLLMALSVHSLFEGLAVGLQPNVDDVLQIFVAVAFHKLVIAFSLGLNLAQSELKLGSMIKSILLFCVSTPIGLAVGMGIEDYGHSVYSSLINGVLQGLACGTFVYVTFFEVLPHELNNGQDRLLKLLSIIIGFACVCGVLFMDPGS
ncbi:hypothetical protein J437_LFUL001803 [Ladona fulva]|uniref:Zinc transporter ZIP1 n=1 Tax=Ladona fulva TaxID=123851 RepID=A0A8K0JX81_LADFU|nr:hypothetical protein J437_LFUL001803 [Ladona fulva]